MSFSDYLYKLLHIIFKRGPRDGSDIDILARGIGPDYDQVKETIFLLREQSLVATATGKALDALGVDRSIRRYPGEPDDLYRRRLLAAYKMYASGGTIPGMREVLRLLGYPDADIHELFRDGVVTPLFNGQHQYNGAAVHSGGKRWAEFKVKADIEEDRSFTAADVDILVEAINNAKPAHTKLAAFVLAMVMGSEYIPWEDVMTLAASWPATDYVLGSHYDHGGSLIRNGAARYNAGIMVDALDLDISMRPVLNEVLPGMARYAAAFRHDGGGARWRHSGSRIRGSRQTYNGAAAHNGQVSRWMAWSRYGDKMATHNGIRNYNYGRRHDGTILRGAASINDELYLVLKRGRQVVEDGLAIA